MFTLASGLYRYLTQRPECFVLILGLDNAGKTTLLQQFKCISNAKYKGIGLDKISPTVGLNVGQVDVGRIRIIFWDLGGQAELRELWEKYYKECHGIVYVVDSADRERLQESRQAFDEMVTHRELESVPLLVVCNKQDVEEAMTIAEVKAVFNESAYKLGVRDCKVMSISATNGHNIQSCLDWISTAVQSNPHRPPNAAS